MNYFRKFRIKTKLIIIQLFTAGVVILLFGIYLIFADQKTYNRAVDRELNTIAQMISANIVSSLDFFDNEMAEYIIFTLENQKNIINAHIYDKEGNIFAKYGKKSYGQYSFAEIAQESLVRKDGYVILSKMIVRGDEVLGQMLIRYELEHIGNKIIQSAIGAMVVMLMGIIVALILSTLTQRTISMPILRLVKMTQEISESHNYSIRIERREGYRKGNDEIEILYGGFDDMLQRIHLREMQRDKAVEKLREQRENLERLVKERTKDLETKGSALEHANIRLQEVDHLKSMFIANMSHELRTPLNSIIGFTGIVLMGMAGELSGEQRKQLTMVKSSANHLLALVNDIIDLSKIEAGKVELIIEQFDLLTVVREVKDSFKVAVDEKSIRLPLMTPKEVLVKSDERRVKQIIVNLVGNAVKFTDEGEVGIEVANKNGMVEVSVRDTGPGIRKEDIDRLFKTFSRIHAEGEEHKEGTGLGLHLSRKIADLLGGEISAVSEFGKGSKFTLSLPLKYKGVEA